MKKQSPRGFKCSVCDQWHQELLRDIGCKLPDAVFALPYLERYRRARYNEDLCTLDGNCFFIRCVLPVPFTHLDGFFGWGVWIEVSEAHHNAYVSHFERSSASVLPFTGTLANKLKAYRATLGLQVLVELSNEHRPFVHLLPESRHPLAIEQWCGIGAERHHELVAPYA